MAPINYPIYLILGVSPSIIWLLFYLRKDVHPEPNSMVIKIFLFGVLITLPVALIGYEIKNFIFLYGENLFTRILYCFFGIALIEEVGKFLVVKFGVLKSSELDEPTDLILYLIIAALGFAALENTLYVFESELLKTAILVTFFRFLVTILAHALWSGTLGYFLALSFYQPEKKLKLFSFGLGLVIFLHGIFDFAIMELEAEKDLRWIFLPVIMILSLAIFIYFGFKRLEKMKSICKIS